MKYIFKGLLISIRGFMFGKGNIPLTTVTSSGKDWLIHSLLNLFKFFELRL